MAFASLFLPMLYIAFLCLCFTLGAILPILTVILAILNGIAFAALLILWFRLKKKGWFSRMHQEQALAQDGGYWKVMGMKAAKGSMLVLMVLSLLGFLICGAIAVMIYL